MALSGKERNKKYEDARRAAGYKRRWLWVAPGADWEKIKKYVERENKKAEGGCQQ